MPDLQHPVPTAADTHGAAAESTTLDRLARGAVAIVASVSGSDAISERLQAMGIWPGARIERLASAPFGGPILFRLHGYRLALLRSEASRVAVTECP